jgi:membrane-bound lytic murein transglycosylase B
MWSTLKLLNAKSAIWFWQTLCGMVALSALVLAAPDAPARDPAGTTTEASAMLAPVDPDFSRWLKALRAEALQRGIRAETLDLALGDVRPVERVIELDRKQPETTMTYEEYIERVVPQSRVEEGRVKLAENATLLDTVSRRYGVEPQFIVAFWGIETSFGVNTGGFPVIDALVTLAYDGRRSAYFRKELFDALTIVDQGHIEPDAMFGSWAGAMGQAQFMPSSFLGYAIDFNRDGRRDIWYTKADVFASAANYLASMGWRGGQGWGIPVRLPAGFDAETAAATKEPKPLETWRGLGLAPESESAFAADPKREAWLVLPAGAAGPAYLTFGNFQAILRWNRSDYFALAVAQLADQIANR